MKPSRRRVPRDPDDVSADEFDEVVDRSAGGPEYRKVIRLLSWVLTLLVVGLIAASVGYIVERVEVTNNSRDSAVFAAANGVEVSNHRIRSEVLYACQVDYLRRIAEAFAKGDRAAVLNIPPCPQMQAGDLDTDLARARDRLRQVDPDHPLLAGDSPTTTPPGP